MDIKKGMRFLCTKNFVMNSTYEFSYKEGRTYLSEGDGCITDEEGDASHIWMDEHDEYADSEYADVPEDYFIPLQKVEYVWTDATPGLKKLFENYKGKREGQRRDMSKVRYFSNQSVNLQDTAFTAYESFDPKLLYASPYYMTPSTFIEFMGLETVKQEVGKELDYRWSYVGRDILGFKFNQDDYPDVGWNDAMESNLYRAGIIEGYNEYNNSFSVRFEDLKAWNYPADMTVDQLDRKDALVEIMEEDEKDSIYEESSLNKHVGKKVSGFKFSTGEYPPLHYDRGMDQFLEELGEIIYYDPDNHAFRVKFAEGNPNIEFSYPVGPCLEQINSEVFNPQPHYDNSKGSLYKIATELGLNHWEFDIFKRLVRCRKKSQFKEDLNKIKDTINIYIDEF